MQSRSELSPPSSSAKMIVHQIPHVTKYQARIRTCVRSKASEDSLQVPDMEKIHGQGITQPAKAIGPRHSVHWSADDVQVTCIQEPHPSRTVIRKRVWHERNPNPPDLNGSSANWTECQEDQARQKAWKLHQELYKTKGAFATTHTHILRRLLCDRVSAHIQAQTDHKVEEEGVFLSTVVLPCA